jgi:hypothetical protein
MNNPDDDVLQPTLDSNIILGGTTHATAKIATEFLVSLNRGFCVLSKIQRRNIVVAYAELGLVLYGKAFDLIRCDLSVNYDDPKDIRRNLKKLVIYEIKSTNKRAVKEDFSRYFFSISTAELLTAQNMGERYRFAFVNTITRTYMDLSLKEVFVKARGIYPWSIQF